MDIQKKRLQTQKQHLPSFFHSAVILFVYMHILFYSQHYHIYQLDLVQIVNRQILNSKVRLRCRVAWHESTQEIKWCHSVIGIAGVVNKSHTHLFFHGWNVHRVVSGVKYLNFKTTPGRVLIHQTNVIRWCFVRFHMSNEVCFHFFLCKFLNFECFYSLNHLIQSQ